MEAGSQGGCPFHALPPDHGLWKENYGLKKFSQTKKFKTRKFSRPFARLLRFWKAVNELGEFNWKLSTGEKN